MRLPRGAENAEADVGLGQPVQQLILADEAVEGDVSQAPLLGLAHDALFLRPAAVELEPHAQLVGQQTGRPQNRVHAV